MSEYLNNIYVRGGMIVGVANSCVGGGIGSIDWWVFVVIMNLLVNRGSSDD